MISEYLKVFLPCPLPRYNSFHILEVIIWKYSSQKVSCPSRILTHNLVEEQINVDLCVSILVMMICYNFAKCYHQGKLGKMYRDLLFFTATCESIIMSIKFSTEKVVESSYISFTQFPLM